MRKILTILYPAWKLTLLFIPRSKNINMPSARVLVAQHSFMMYLYPTALGYKKAMGYVNCSLSTTGDPSGFHHGLRCDHSAAAAAAAECVKFGRAKS